MDKSVSSETEGTAEIHEDKTVRCKSCEHDITKPSLAIQPHEHTFRNPAGFSFHLVCYSDAPGAADVGIPTAEYTWFAGYSWSFAICLKCQDHLGWWYSGADRFVGLIATRLIR